jgi:hypothetical protein
LKEKVIEKAKALEEVGGNIKKLSFNPYEEIVCDYVFDLNT